LTRHFGYNKASRNDNEKEHGDCFPGECMACKDENRVVVTGLGVVSPLGVGLKPFWDGLLAGRSGISRITHFDASDFPSQIAGEIPGFNAEDWIDRKSARRMDRVAHLGIASSTMALEDAKLDVASLDPNRVGVSIGSGIGGSATIEEGHRALLEKGPRGVSPFFVSKILVNMTACMVSIRHGLKGPLAACSVACSTGANAVGDAYRILQRGDADVMLAGSSEASVNPLPFAGFCAARSMSKRNDSPETASRPFEKNRDGFVMGEGAGVAILERLDHAQARGARAYAEIVGYGSTADAHHFTAPHPEGDGMARVMRGAIDDAGLAPEDIGYVNAHGTSTVLNDKTESMAIAKVFGEHAARLKVSSNKSMIGHLMAAAGAVEFVSTVMAVHTGQVPPTINLEEPDPECQLDYVTNGAEALDLTAALSNSFGFGGGNASLIVKNHLHQARP
jgi:3-oxoacyl-[acyl-carrier-protein] synthase II